MDVENLNLLMQYIDSLEQASEDLEKAYFRKDVSEVKEIKKFMKDVQSKINSMLP